MSWIRRLFGQRDSAASAQDVSASPAPANHTASQPSTSTAATVPVASSQSAPDLVDGLNALAAYYRYVEAQAYDAALKSVRSRRDFREEFLARSDALLAYADDEYAMRQIQIEIDKEAAAFASPDRGYRPPDVAGQARALDSDGYRLLALSSPLTWDSLKSAYRAAAKIHHPDVGGDNATMRRVNDAYGLFTALLKRQAAEEGLVGVQPPSEPMTAERFFADVRLHRFYACVDDLAADAAYDWYRAIDLSDMERAFECAGSLAKLAELLAASNRPQDAALVLHDLGMIAERAARRQLNYGPIFRRASEACCDPKHIRFIPNHMRQADNLFRLGIIDKRRYDATVKRIGSTESKLADDSAAFAQFVRSRKFLTLPMDVTPKLVAMTELVPAPEYYARAETLSDAQRSEYVAAYHGEASDLAQKYLPIRLDALLRAPFAGAEIDAVLGELRAFESAPGLTAGMHALCEEAINVIAFLAAEPVSERKKRIDLLKRLDCDPRDQSFVISIAFDGRTASALPSGPITRPIFLNPQFTTFATGSLERIERYARTGSELTPQEQERQHAQQRRVWEQARAFYESDVYKRARDATSAKEKDPERIVPAVSALCEALYERVDRGDAEALEIAYWTDKLTINLVKVRRFEEALRWIGRFESASEAVRARASASVVDAIQKRRARCEAEVAASATSRAQIHS
jgi:hypothetical protein